MAQKVVAGKVSGFNIPIKEPKTATLLFRSGKMVCTGAKSLEHVKRAIGIVTAQLRKFGVHLDGGKLGGGYRSVLVVGIFGRKINLSVIALTLGLDRVEYEPEQFPAWCTAWTSRRWFCCCSPQASLSAPVQRCRRT